MGDFEYWLDLPFRYLEPLAERIDAHRARDSIRRVAELRLANADFKKDTTARNQMNEWRRQATGGAQQALPPKPNREAWRARFMARGMLRQAPQLAVVESPQEDG